MYLNGVSCCPECEESDDDAPGLAGLGFSFGDWLKSGFTGADSGEQYDIATDFLNPGGGGPAIPGLDPLGLLQTATSLIPGVGPMLSAAEGIFATAYNTLEDWFHIGAGRSEADVITPVQNQVKARLDAITQALVRGASVQTLQGFYSELQRLGAGFQQFVSDAKFTDGRASEQALNTIMPYIDGTCGYHWPPPLNPTQRGCLQWGDGTPGGVGSDGMLGAVSRALARLGGRLPPPVLTQGAGVPSLQVLTPGAPQIPQSGTLPTRTQSTYRAASIVPVGGGSDSTMLLVGAAVIGALMFQRRR